MTIRLLGALLLVVLLFALGFKLRDYMFEPQPRLQGAAPSQPSAAGAPALPAPVTSLTVTELAGGVELREAADQHWQPLTAPVRIGDSDALRTREGGSAVITGGDGVRVELAEKSQLNVAKLQPGVSSLTLESGRLAARVSGGRSKLQVSVEGNPAVVNSAEGAFAVLRSPDGQVTVATTQGRTGIRAREHELQLMAGEQSIVPVDKPPTPPSRIPATLFLKVARSGPARLNRRETELGGQTTPGAQVSVNGVVVVTDSRGRFSAKVPLREGSNALEITAHDALGRREHQTLMPVHVDTEAPKVEGKVVW
jgi:hypothetical protein